MSPRGAQPAMTRFWRKVNKDGAMSRLGTKCWDWTAGRSYKGYGRFLLNGINRHAHQVAWELSRGSREHLQVLHKCNNRICVNPNHLYLGTNRDNVDDRVAYGNNRTFRIIPTATIEAIRREYQPRTPGRGPRILGQKYSVHPSYIYHIVSRRYRKDG